MTKVSRNRTWPGRAHHRSVGRDGRPAGTRAQSPAGRRTYGDISRRAPAAPRPVDGRELEVLGLIAEGLSNDAIAGRLNVSVNVVEFNSQPIVRNLGLADAVGSKRRVVAALLYRDAHADDRAPAPKAP